MKLNLIKFQDKIIVRPFEIPSPPSTHKYSFPYTPYTPPRSLFETAYRRASSSNQAELLSTLFERLGSTEKIMSEAPTRTISYHIKPDYYLEHQINLLSELQEKEIDEPSPCFTEGIPEEEKKGVDPVYSVDDPLDPVDPFTLTREATNLTQGNSPTRKSLLLERQKEGEGIVDRVTHPPARARSRISIVLEKSTTMSKEVVDNFNIIESMREIPYEQIHKRKINLKFPPKKETKKTLILDMDDTLIHTLRPYNDYPESQVPKSTVIPLSFQEYGYNSYFSIVVRPYALQLLKEMSPLCEIIIFTAAESPYANCVLDYLDRDGEYIDHRIYRENCIRMNRHFVKDLRIFKNRNMSDMVIVDNSIVSFCKQMTNGIHVPSYVGHHRDRELKGIMHYLRTLIQETDVRPQIKSKFLLPHLFSFHTNSFDQLDDEDL